MKNNSDPLGRWSRRWALITSEPLLILCVALVTAIGMFVLIFLTSL